MKALLTLLTFILIGCAPLAQGPVGSEMQQRKQAADQLMEVLDMKKQLDEALRASMDVQIQQNPQLAQFRDVMEEFFIKYFNYSTIKEPLTNIYAETFTVQELNDLIAFYKTPTGQKAALKQTELMQKGMQIGQQQVQKHMPELQQMIAQRMKEMEKEK